MPGKLAIDIVSDPVCPWCLVGLRRLNNALKRLPDGAVEITHHPFLLDAKAPPEGEDVVEMLREKYGRDPFEAWDRLEAEAASSGIELDMRKQKKRYPSQRAQVLIAAAGNKGTQHALAIAIGDAYYFDARDISDPEVLVELGEALGFTRDEVLTLIMSPDAISAIERASAQMAGQNGIGGVPYFVFGRKYALSGAQPDAVFAEVLETAQKEIALQTTSKTN